MTAARWLGRSLRRDRVAGDSETPVEKLGYLPPEAQDALASLHGAPASVCQAVVQLLPLGSRIALEQSGLARERDVPGDHYRLVLTPMAYEVMEAAAASAEGFNVAEDDLEDVDELDQLDQRMRTARAARAGEPGQ